MADNTHHSNNPWKGLNFYVEGEVLYGRDREIESLSQYIINNTQTVLYGKSGIGKSSILNAGVFPIARRQGLLPIGIRLDHSTSISYVRQIKTAIESQGDVEIHQILPAINEDDETLWEYLHRNVFFNSDGLRVQLLLVLDQFEEIFTLQQNEKRKRAFFQDLASLLNDVTPLYIVNASKQQQAGQQADAQEVTTELSDLDIDLDLEGITTETAHYLSKVDYHIVFTLREDFLSYLERYTAYIPVMKSNRFALLPLNEEQAADIIMKPRPGLVSRQVAGLIIQKVTGKEEFLLDSTPEFEVDAAVLSLYLSRLYEKKGDSETITDNLVYQFSDDIIKDFYEESVADLPAADIEKIEDQLLTYDGRRNNVSRNDLISEGVNAKSIQLLVEDRKLLRQFSYQDDIRVEFMHDILCPVVDARINQREAVKQQEEEHRHQEEALKRSQRRMRHMASLFAFLLLLLIVGVLLLWPRLPERYYQLRLTFAASSEFEPGEPWNASFRLVAHENDSLVQLPVQTPKGTPVDSLVVSNLQRNEFILSVPEGLLNQAQHLRVEIYNSSKNCKIHTDTVNLSLWVANRQHTISVNRLDKIALHGQVVSAQDGKPVNGAYVVFGQQPMQTTRADGRFTFYLDDSTDVARENLYAFKEDHEAEHIQGSLLLASGMGLGDTPLVLPLTSTKTSSDDADNKDTQTLFQEQRKAFTSLFDLAWWTLRKQDDAQLNTDDSLKLESALKVYPHFALQRANLRRIIITNIGDSATLYGVTLLNPQVDGIRDVVGNYYHKRRDNHDHLYQGKFIRSGNGPYWYLEATGHDINNTPVNIKVKLQEGKANGIIDDYTLEQAFFVFL